ncbi:hypothetical protein [Variovorax sp. WDL1]|uniref:hypothetical protein n=1 Tax=Variovorax sp. WDL1 TaxID=207745 RepID=UPI000AE01943|nr:hypothetical protein [Variovorax sp. WDL1]
MRLLERADHVAQALALALQGGDPGAGVLDFVVSLRMQSGHASAAFELEGQVDGSGCVAGGLVALQVRRLTPRWRAMFLRDSIWSASRKARGGSRGSEGATNGMEKQALLNFKWVAQHEG